MIDSYKGNMNHIKFVLASLKELSSKELGVQFDWVHILMVGLFVFWVTSQVLKDHTMSEQHIHRKVIEELWLKQKEVWVLKGKLEEASSGSTTFVNNKKICMQILLEKFIEMENLKVEWIIYFKAHIV